MMNILVLAEHFDESQFELGKLCRWKAVLEV
jgi:hypothetical protein